MMVYLSSNTMQSTIIMIIAYVYDFQSKLWSQDVSRKHLQSQRQLAGKQYAFREKLILKPEQLLKLMKYLFRLTESRDYWVITLRKHPERYPKVNWATENHENFTKQFERNCHVLLAYMSTKLH